MTLEPRHEHDWGTWHWFITSPGWVRFCPTCETWDPPAENAGRYEHAYPTEGLLCTVCKPGKPCCLGGQATE